MDDTKVVICNCSNTRVKKFGNSTIFITLNFNEIMEMLKKLQKEKFKNKEILGDFFNNIFYFKF